MRVVIGVTVAALLICGAGEASAQSEAYKRIARKHYELGEQFYKISNYPGALSEFNKAYKLYPLPSMLFNIARCHEVMANLDKAVKYYRLYLEKDPKTRRRGLVEDRIRVLRQRIDARKPKPPLKPVPPLKPPQKPAGPPRRARTWPSTPNSMPNSTPRGTPARRRPRTCPGTASRTPATWANGTPSPTSTRRPRTWGLTPGHQISWSSPTPRRRCPRSG